jgi:hypothetical protein
MSQVLTGSKASVKLNGVKIAFASGVNINHDLQLTDIDVLDDLLVAEHAETGAKFNFSVTLFKMDRNTAKSFGLDPDNIDALLAQPELTFEVYNRVEDRVEYVLTGVKFAGGSGSVDARGVWAGTWNFMARRGTGL